MLSKVQRMAALYFKYKGGFVVDQEGRPIEWKNSEPIPTDADLLKILNSKEFKIYDEGISKKYESEKIKRELMDIDIKSIRAIREWLAQQQDVPSFVVEYEELAKEKRKKLK